MQNPLEKYFEDKPAMNKSELARRTDSSKTMITLVCQDERRPSPELAVKIANVTGQSSMIAYWYPELAAALTDPTLPAPQGTEEVSCG